MDLPQMIQSVLAPGIMISSSALLLLGFQNKFSNLASRFRALNHEKRILLESKNLSSSRLPNLEKQIHDLGKRAAYVKKAIVMAYLAILFFTSTSLLIFFQVYVNWKAAEFTVAFFLLGMMLIFLSSFYMIRETLLFYRIIMLEKES